MIAYLIGGPQDMVKMRLNGDTPVIRFPHIPEPPLSAVPGAGHEYVTIQTVDYRKVYESFPSRDGNEFSIYVLMDRR